MSGDILSSLARRVTLLMAIFLVEFLVEGMVVSSTTREVGRLLACMKGEGLQAVLVAKVSKINILSILSTSTIHLAQAIGREGD